MMNEVHKDNKPAISKSTGFESPDLGVIIAAGGAATRFDKNRNKLLCDLGGIPVICHCLRTFLKMIPAQNIVVAVPPDQESAFRQAFRAASLDAEGILCVSGGIRRQDSIINALHQLPPHITLVAVQDAARPWTSETLLAACADSARKHGSGVAAHRVTDTIKVADGDGRVHRTLPREELWASETPQVFQRKQLEAAYQKVKEDGIEVTDDAQAVELAGFPVFLVEHREINNKITYAADLQDKNT